MKIISISVVAALVSIGNAATAVPIAHCSNDAKTANVEFAYYQNITSESVEVDDIFVMNVNGKSYTQNDREQDDRGRRESKVGFVLFKDSTALVVAELARTATIYNIDGNTLAKLNCGR